MADSDTQQFDDGVPDEMRQAIVFMQNANRMSDMKGACVLEVFTCPHCHTQQRSAHQFCETLKCGKCGKTTKSRVPRLPTEGEITAEAMIEAIRLVRNTLPDVPKETREWCLKQEGAVRTVACTLAVYEARRILDMVQDVARKLSGGHGT